MKIITAFYTLLLLVSFSLPSKASIVLPGDTTIVAHTLKVTPAGPASNRSFDKSLSGKKPGFAERLKKHLLQKSLLRKFAAEKGEPTERQKKQGKLSMILGIASLVLLFIPTIGIVAIPAAIAAIVFGAISLKGNSNTQGLVGLITGGVTLLLVIIGLILFVALFSGF